MVPYLDKCSRVVVHAVELNLAVSLTGTRLGAHDSPGSSRGYLVGIPSTENGVEVGVVVGVEHLCLAWFRV